MREFTAHPAFRRIVVVLGVEFFERTAYYGVVFSLASYALNLLRVDVSLADIVVNAVYAAAPLLSLVGAQIVDRGVLARPQALVIFGTVYTLGITFIALSALPIMYRAFPDGPRPVAFGLFIVGLFLFCAGFGPVKTVATPLLGEQIEDYTDTSDIATVRDTIHNPQFNESLVAGEEEAARSPRSLAIEELRPSSPYSDTLKRSMATFFLAYFWVINAGSMLGIFVSPLLRQVYGPTIKGVEGDASSTGYWVGFLTFALWLCCGIAIFAAHVNQFMTADRRRRVAQAIVLSDPSSASRAVPRCEDPRCEVPQEGSESCRSSMRSFLPLLQLLTPLPVYWLCQSQTSTNFIILAGCTDLPSWLQADALNNAGTISLLVALPLVKLLNIRLPQTRMLIGFFVSCGSMFAGAIVQHLANQRGTLRDDGTYTLFDGASRLSGAWVAIPFATTNIASAFADPTVLEAAYLLAPNQSRSTAMSLYLIASSASGFLGLAFSPVSVPRYFVHLFIGMGVSLAVIASLWFVWMTRCRCRNGATFT